MKMPERKSGGLFGRKEKVVGPLGRVVAQTASPDDQEREEWADTPHSGPDVHAAGSLPEDDTVRVDVSDMATGFDGPAHDPIPEVRYTEVITPAAKTGIFGKAKAPKPPKPPKPPKAPKVPKSQDEDDHAISLPVLAAIDYYRGFVKPAEAAAMARSFIEKNFDAPNSSYYYVQPWRGGMAVEMQMGGGKAYLPEVLRRLDENEEAVLAVSMSNRIMTVRYDDETQKLECLMLNEGQSPPPEAFVSQMSKEMEPYDKRGSRMFVFGIGAFVIGFMSIMFAIGMLFLDIGAWALPKMAQTRIKDLPTAQMPAVEAAVARGDCLAKMQFANGTWVMTTGFDNNGVCGLQRSVAPAPAIVEGDMLPPGQIAPQVSPPPMAMPPVPVAPVVPGQPVAPAPVAVAPPGLPVPAAPAVPPVPIPPR